MVLKDFYKILEKKNFSSMEDFSVMVDFNPDHEIFTGHFPGNPVVPGVCLIQTIKEILELKFNKKMNLTNGDNIKFQTMINPKNDNNIILSFSILDQSEELKIKCKAHKEATTFFAFTGRFRSLN